ncbi:bifunctional riboflavin kinase/FAD synthetase [Aurantivibrio infirmus]
MSQRNLIRGLINLRPEHKGPDNGGNVVTVGAFDGMHIGHQAIIRQVTDKARELNLASAAIIFEPLPREFFQCGEGIPRLQPFREKLSALFAAGIDRVLCVRFNEKFSQASSLDFVDDVLLSGLGVKHLVIGDDFRFGHDRCGDFEFLNEQGKLKGFSLSRADTVDVDGDRVSSTRLRELLAANNFDQAARLLGRRFTVAGKVCFGKQLGRQLGVPTANLFMRRNVSPITGTFITRVHLGDKVFDAVTNVGLRPTVNDELRPLLETHLLDYKGDLYGRRISVDFLTKLRDEKKFSSLDELKKQIQMDVSETKSFFDTLER